MKKDQISIGIFIVSFTLEILLSNQPSFFRHPSLDDVFLCCSCLMLKRKKDIKIFFRLSVFPSLLFRFKCHERILIVHKNISSTTSVIIYSNFYSFIQKFRLVACHHVAYVLTPFNHNIAYAYLFK